MDQLRAEMASVRAGIEDAQAQRAGALKEQDSLMNESRREKAASSLLTDLRAFDELQAKSSVLRTTSLAVRGIIILTYCLPIIMALAIGARRDSYKAVLEERIKWIEERTSDALRMRGS
jgi:hypothetical protein